MVDTFRAQLNRRGADQGLPIEWTLDTPIKLIVNGGRCN